MIENFNVTKNSSSENYADVKKYIGVASINVLAVNPNNATLRMYGWQIPEDADEPKYVTTNNDGKKSARVRFLVQLNELKDKPVIPLDFWIQPDFRFTSDPEKSKCQIIDAFGRTAYATKQEYKEHAIPRYANGLASISSDYKACHVGEENLVKFIMKLLNVTPLKMFVKASNQWVDSKNPGRLTIDDWGALCNGDVSEINGYLKLQPDNRVKVILGIKTSDDNKTYQTFLASAYLGNGSRVDITTGEYVAARKALDKDREYADQNNKPYPFIYSAVPVKEWAPAATEVSDNSNEVDMPDFEDDMPFRD